MTPRRLRRAAWTITALYAGFHFVMTHLPPGNVPALRTSDKTLHFLSYGFLSGCLYLTLWVSGISIRRAGLLVLFSSATFAVFDEILQAPIGRDPELMDWVVDVAAAVVAVVCFSLVRLAIRKPAEPPVAPAPGD
ncbi:MAG TPA: VanZ family protein [Tepidisphaeraceae bacterium]|nr:VanZ family protein [Tepidisphaeraceae bacterium]